MKPLLTRLLAVMLGPDGLDRLLLELVHVCWHGLPIGLHVRLALRCILVPPHRCALDRVLLVAAYLHGVFGGGGGRGREVPDGEMKERRRLLVRVSVRLHTRYKNRSALKKKEAPALLHMRAIVLSLRLSSLPPLSLPSFYLGWSYTQI